MPIRPSLSPVVTFGGKPITTSVPEKSGFFSSIGRAVGGFISDIGAGLDIRKPLPAPSTAEQARAAEEVGRISGVNMGHELARRSVLNVPSLLLGGGIKGLREVGLPGAIPGALGALSIGGRRIETAPFVGEQVEEVAFEKGVGETASKILGFAAELIAPAGTVRGGIGVLGRTAVKGEKAGAIFTGAIPKSERAVAKEAGELVDSVQKLKGTLKEMDTLFESQQSKRALEQASRFAKGLKTAKGLAGKEKFTTELSALKGSLPKETFGKFVSDNLSPKVQDDLFKLIDANTVLNRGEKLHAASFLLKLFSGDDVLSSNYARKQLMKVLGDDTVKLLVGKQKELSMLSRAFPELVNMPRAFMASFDFSMPFRQTLPFIARHPIKGLKNFVPMVRSAFSGKFFDEFNNRILSDPQLKRLVDENLIVDLESRLAGREEAFMSSWAERVPVIGPIVKASNRAATTFNNAARRDLFKSMSSASKKIGRTDVKDVDQIIEFVGAATGRGSLGRFSKSAVELNSFFFSPKLAASRWHFLDPRNYVKMVTGEMNPVVRKEFLTSVFAMLGWGLGILGAAKLNGMRVGDDPDSADYGKIVSGDTRIDVWGGFQQYAVLAHRLASGKYVSSTTGVEVTLGEDFRTLNRWEIILRFLQNKEAPVASFITGWLQGTNATGQKFELAPELVDRFVPMVLADLRDIVKSGDLKNLGFVVPAIFGVGLQTYLPDPQQLTRAGNSAQMFGRKLAREGKTEEAERYFAQAEDLIILGESLEPFVSAINKLERARKIASPEEIVEIDEAIDDLQRQADALFQEIRLPGNVLRR